MHQQDDIEPVDLDTDQVTADLPPGPHGGYNLQSKKCGAKTKSGGTCGKHPSKGSNRCKFHGGASPQVKARVEREEHQRKVEHDIQKAMKKLDITPVGDPLTALKNLAGEVLAWKDMLLEKVESLRTLRYATEFNEQIRGEVLLYERAIERAVNVLATIARLNIDERLVAVTERQAKMLEDGLFAAFDEVGITISQPEMREAVAVAFGKHLSLLPPTA